MTLVFNSAKLSLSLSVATLYAAKKSNGSESFLALNCGLFQQSTALVFAKAIATDPLFHFHSQ